MSLLKSEPPAPVRSLGELFALAEAMEEEAARRYATLAAEMRAAGMPAVARAFEGLVAEERSHADSVREWSRARTGAEPDPAHIRWEPPDTFDEEETRAIASSSLATAYRALSMAVRNEERAFALWTYIAAQSEDAAIREAAERMAAEELRHAALLRRARRQAYHAERQAMAGPDRVAPRRPAMQEAAWAERELAALLAGLAAEPAAAEELRRWARETAGMAEQAARLAAAASELPAAVPDDPARPATLPEAARLAERALEASLDAADHAAEEAAMRDWQSLAARGIERSAALRRLAIREQALPPKGPAPKGPG